MKYAKRCKYCGNDFESNRPNSAFCPNTDHRETYYKIKQEEYVLNKLNIILKTPYKICDKCNEKLPINKFVSKYNNINDTCTDCYQKRVKETYIKLYRENKNFINYLPETRLKIVMKIIKGER